MSDRNEMTQAPDPMELRRSQDVIAELASKTNETLFADGRFVILQSRPITTP